MSRYRGPPRLAIELVIQNAPRAVGAADLDGTSATGDVLEGGRAGWRGLSLGRHEWRTEWREKVKRPNTLTDDMGVTTVRVGGVFGRWRGHLRAAERPRFKAKLANGSF